ncbi:MAG: TlpA disulfide reductase family protein, partial [Candidatus Rokuibacteriota bacterium]
ARDDAPAAPGPPPAPRGPSPAPAEPRLGRRLSVDAAIRELELIRPPRSKVAEDFTASLLGGTRFRLVEQRGAVVLINFWATWCPPCREEMPSMERLWRRHRDRGFLLVAVSLDSDPALVGPFMAEHKLTFPVAIDSRLEIANLYGVRALPTSFVLDRAGTIVALAQGPRTWDNDAAHSLIEGLTR